MLEQSVVEPPAECQFQLGLEANRPLAERSPCVDAL